MPLDDAQLDRLESILSSLDTLSAQTDEDGNGEILDSLLDVIDKILERYPALQEEEE